MKQAKKKVGEKGKLTILVLKLPQIWPVIAISSSLHFFLSYPHYSLSTALFSGKDVLIHLVVSCPSPEINLFSQKPRLSFKKSDIGKPRSGNYWWSVCILLLGLSLSEHHGIIHVVHKCAHTHIHVNL